MFLEKAKNNVEGFIFYLLLLFLHLFSLLSLYLWMNISLMIRENNHLWQREIILSQSKVFLQRLKDRLPFLLSRCSIRSYNFIEQSLFWWQSHACSEKLNKISYYYVVEALGNDPCGIVKKDSKSVFIADYYRITLLALRPEMQVVNIRLQMTLVKSIESSFTCTGRSHSVSEGLQKWLEI